ncbi:formyltransferase family protein [Natronolimnohabitans sp. A-GB9]|uniref:formyltransferase family protein n=1 Tax=Natronolimnohabitans sp. A-GB9 TaxID=3069757 RepID=UPI0027B2BD4E|nr:formyltransferase family protein [Natronolimnohabitans sp. A-GB9]MDQ2052038.1 formyltransferase family protein [Natronolimnohabitans sp. A-GB9]
MQVGILVDPRIPSWHEEAIKNVAELEDVDITYVVVDASSRNDTTTKSGAEAIDRDALVTVDDLKLFYDVLREDGLKAFLYADQKFGWHYFGETKRRDWLRTKEVSDVDCLTETTVKECEPNSDGVWNTLPPAVVSEIEERCDVVLRFGFGLIKGDVLTAPEHGVLSVHGSDIREYRGMGPKLSFLNGDDTVTVTLQRLTEDIDGGAIVSTKSAPVSDTATLDEVGGTVYQLSTEIYADGVRKLRDGGSAQRAETLGEYYSHDLQKRDPRFVGKIVLKNNYYRMKSALGT